MGADENFDVTHRLTMLGMDEIGILVIHVEEVLEHTEYKSWNSKNLGKGTETEWTGEGDEEGNCQHSKKYPPLFTP